MPDDVREYLRAAQAAEIRGDKVKAVDLLNKAAAAYRDGGKSARAEQMLRHARRLQGLAQEESEAETVDAEEASAPLRLGESFEGRGTGDRRRRLELIKRGPIVADPSLRAWCSFCCRPDQEVGPLVAGPAVAYICAQCLRESQALFKVSPVTSPLGREVGLRSEPDVSAAAKCAAFASQAPEVKELEAAMRGSASLILLLGPPGCGKTSCLRHLESRGAGHYVDLAQLGWESPRLPEGRLLIDGIEHLAGTTQATFLNLIAEQPDRQVIVAARGKSPTRSLVLHDGSRRIDICSTHELTMATGAKLLTELLERVEQVIALPALTAAQLAELARRAFQARDKATAVSESLVQALANRAAKSGRGGHELVALVARIPAGSWAVDAARPRKRRKT
jgi:hypothetical protein